MTTKTRVCRHQMDKPLLGGMVGCRWCDFAVKETPAPSVQGSKTSSDAAHSIEGGPRTKARSAVLEAIRKSVNGLTAEKISAITGYPGDTVRPRIVELVRLNLIEDSKRVSLTRSGRQAVLWVAR